MNTCIFSIHTKHIQNNSDRNNLIQFMIDLGKVDDTTKSMVFMFIYYLLPRTFPTPDSGVTLILGLALC